QERAHEAPLVAKLVGDDPLEHDAVAYVVRAAACPVVAIQIDTDDDVGGRRIASDGAVVAPAVERVEAGARRDGSENRGVPEALEAAGQPGDRDPGAAAFGRARRRRAEKPEPHPAQRPWNFGGRFSRNARVPSL